MYSISSKSEYNCWQTLYSFNYVIFKSYQADNGNIINF